MGKHIQEGDLKTVNGQSLIGEGDLNIEGGGINPENIGFGLSYSDDKIQMGESVTSLNGDTTSITPLSGKTSYIIGDIMASSQKGAVFGIGDTSTGRFAMLGTNEGGSDFNGFQITKDNFRLSRGENSVISIRDKEMLLSVGVSKISIKNNEATYNLLGFSGEIATVPFVEDYVSKNGGEIGEVHDLGGSKFRVLNYAEDAFMIGDFEKASQNMGASVLISDNMGSVVFGYNNENGTNQAFVSDEGFTMEKLHTSGRSSSITVGDGVIKLALQNPGKYNTYLRLEGEEILMSSLYKKYNPITEEYESTLMEGSVASAKYVDTKVEELTAIIADLQRQINELKN